MLSTLHANILATLEAVPDTGEAAAAASSIFDNWTVILPSASLALAAVVVMIVGLFVRGRQNEDINLALFFCALGGALLSLITSFQQIGQPVQSAFSGTLRADGFAAFLGIIIAVATLFAILGSFNYHKRIRVNLADFLTLILLSASGMVLLSYAYDLIVLFVAFELMSIPIYILVGAARNNERSIEGSVKYLVLGTFATAFLVFGLMLLYGMFSTVTDAAGLPATTQLTSLAPLMTDSSLNYNLPIAILALALIVISFGFKLGVVPFHQWIPDVYDGAPAVITGFMAVAVKAAVFGAFLRILLVCFPADAQIEIADAVGEQSIAFGDFIGFLLIAVCVLTILLGNLLAVTQESFKRMLAYSSIAHTGYLLMGLIAVTSAGAEPGAGWQILFYLLAYTFTTMAAFLILIWAGGTKEIDKIAELQGLARRKPLIGFAMLVAMISLAGIPLTAGFFGKLWIFYAALEMQYYGLVIVAVIGSIIGVYYYLRVVYTIYMKPEKSEQAFLAPDGDRWAIAFGVGLATVAILIIGLVPGPFVELSKTAVETLLGP